MTTKRVALMVSIVLFGAGLAMGQTVWEQYPGNPIIEPGDVGAWGELGASVSTVVFDGTTYHMWFASYDADDWPTDIGHATSPDGIAWAMDPDNPVLTRGAPGEWNEGALRYTAVIYDGSQFHMWFEGWDSAQLSRIGYATSPDGSVWTEYPDNPVMDAPPLGDWDDWGPGPSSVIATGDGYRMWYAASKRFVGGTRVGYAESSDGINWTKHPHPVLEPSTEGWDSHRVEYPEVIFDGSTYHMWYTGREAQDSVNGASIGYAFSHDGLSWNKHYGNPVVREVSRYYYTSPVVFDGSTCRMWYSYYDLEFDWIHHATSDCSSLSTNSVRFIPAAAFASGAHSSFFVTDVDVSNAGGQSATYHFSWLPRGVINSDPVTSETFSLGAGKSVRYENIVDALFGQRACKGTCPDLLGSLAITASSPDLLSISRIYNVSSAKSGGTFGQSMPAIPVGEFIQSGDRRRILFGTEHADMRTNVGCQNGSDHSTTVKLELFDAAGTSLGTTTMELPPLGNNQINRIFEEYAPVTGAVDVWTDDPDRRFYCYGSVLDNVTSDPTTIPPQ